MTIETRTDFEPVEVEQTREGEGWSETTTEYETREVETDVIVCDIELPECDYDIGPKDSPDEHAKLAANPGVDTSSIPNPWDIIEEFREGLEERGTTIEPPDTPRIVLNTGAVLVLNETCQESPTVDGVPLDTEPKSETDEEETPTKTIYSGDEISMLAEHAVTDAIGSIRPTLEVDQECHVCSTCADKLGIECTHGHVDTEQRVQTDDDESESDAFGRLSIDAVKYGLLGELLIALTLGMGILLLTSAELIRALGNSSMSLTLLYSGVAVVAPAMIYTIIKARRAL